MHQLRTATVLAFAALAALPARAQIFSPVSHALVWDKCGGQDELACGVTDPAYFLLPDNSKGATRCDRTLSPVPTPTGIRCQDLGKRNIYPDAIMKTLNVRGDDQFNRISADLPINLVPRFGTHNSFSNYKDGSGNKMTADQELTITEQLQLGARYIRLDPRPLLNSGAPILCHSSDLYNVQNSFLDILVTLGLPRDGNTLCLLDFPNVPPLPAGPFSYLRPFFYGLKEVRYWLEHHPGEFIVLVVNNFGGTSEMIDLDPAIEQEFGSMLYAPGQPTAPWPTLRQLRSMGKRLIVFADRPTSNGQASKTSFAHNSFTVGAYDSTNPALARCSAPGVTDTTSITERGLSKWIFIGEDRSVSNKFLPEDAQGLINAGIAFQATHCGYSSFNLDFLNALDKAAKISVPGFTVDYTDGGAADKRPDSVLWSWSPIVVGTPPAQPATVQRTGTPVFSVPAYLGRSGAYSWTPAAPGTPFPYACASASAASFPSLTNPWGYNWAITTRVGQWSDGETACQQEFGGAYHFWRPMSAVENDKLTELMNATLYQRVWVNHFSGKTVALPDILNFTHALGGPAQSRTLVVTSGFGGALSAIFTPANSQTPQLVTVSPVPDTSNLFTVTLDPLALASKAPGTYSGLLTVKEVDPVTAVVHTFDAKVTVDFTRPLASLTATPATVDFKNGLVQTVNITSSDPTQIIRFDANTAPPAWLTYQLSSNATPAVLTVTADPAKAPTQSAATLPLLPTSPSFGSAKVDFTISRSQVTVVTQPAGLTVNVDGLGTATPATFNWVTGSTHTIAAAGIANNGTVYSFGSWSDSGAAVHSVIAGAQPSYTATFNTAYQLTLSAQPASTGTVTVLNPQPGHIYPAQSAVTLIANAHPGYVFQGFTGGAVSALSPLTITMDSAKTIHAVFVVKQTQTTIATNPAGRTVVVDGVPYTAPITFNWGAEQHVVTVLQQPDTARGVRYSFSNWSDGYRLSTRTITSGLQDTTYTVNLATEYLVTTAIVPSGAGTVTGDGWFSAGAVVMLDAKPVTGFTFAGFTIGSNPPVASPMVLIANKPYDVSANFKATGQASLYASAGARTDAGNNVINVPIKLTNVGNGPAGDAKIVDITGITVPQGGGQVTVPVPPGGWALGTISPGKLGQVVVPFNWPVTVTRVQFTVKYTANGGLYQGSNTITLFR